MTIPTHSHRAALFRSADGANRLVASAGEDGFIRVWDFRKRTLKAEIKVGAGQPCCALAALRFSGVPEGWLGILGGMDVLCTVCCALLPKPACNTTPWAFRHLPSSPGGRTREAGVQPPGDGAAGGGLRRPRGSHVRCRGANHWFLHWLC